MSTLAVSHTPLSPQLQQYFQTRQSDLQQLGHALNTGNLDGAQNALNNIVALGKNGPFAGGDAFKIAQREQNFTAVQQAIQSGDLAGAKQAFGALRETFERPTPTPVASSTPNTAPGSGPEIILNLSNTAGSNASPEQITINVANAAGGGEQVSLSVGNQGSSQQQVTCNLPPNSNEQIVLNLLGPSSGSSGSASSSSGSSGSTSSGGALSVSA